VLSSKSVFFQLFWQLSQQRSPTVTYCVQRHGLDRGQQSTCVEKNSVYHGGFATAICNFFLSEVPPHLLAHVWVSQVQHRVLREAGEQVQNHNSPKPEAFHLFPHVWVAKRQHRVLCEAGEQVLRHELRKRLLLRIPHGIQPHDREIAPPRVRRIIGAPVSGAQLADSAGHAVELHSRCAQYLLFLEDVSRSFI